MIINTTQCFNSMSISLDKNNMIYDSYCCRAWYNETNRHSFEYVYNNTKEYLDKIFSEFQVKERYPNGYCVRYNKNTLCNCKIYPIKQINQINLGTLTKCNYDCPNCSQKYNRNNGNPLDMELSITKKIISELSNYPNITKIQLSNSGEIFCYNINELLQIIPKNITNLEFLTNGYNMKYLNLQDVDINYIISFPSLDREIYKKLTGGINSLDTVKTNIINLSKKTKNIYLNFILFKENYTELEDIKKFSDSLGIKLYVLANMFDNSMKAKILELRKQYKDILFEGVN